MCYQGINNIEDILLPFFKPNCVKQIHFTVDSHTDDPVFIVKNTGSVEYLSVDFPIGMVGVNNCGKHLTSLDLHGSTISKSMFASSAPLLTYIKLRGKLTGYKTGQLLSTRLFDHHTFDVLDITAKSQQDMDFILYIIQDATRIHDLIIRYSMPCAIIHACPTVVNLTLIATFDASIDLIYHTMLLWTDLESILIQRGELLNALFTVRISEADDYELRDIFQSLLNWNLTTDDFVSLEIDRYT
jgi:hypothetical protein